MADPVETLAVQTCWSCRGPVAARELFCATCGAVQPPGVADPFTRLGVVRGFAIDEAALQRRYFDLQRKLHPDRFAAKSARERALSQQQAASLNEAYETLKDPLARAAALLRLAGREVKFDGQATIDDPELLMEAMEMREALAEASTAAEGDAVLARAHKDVTACTADLAAAFARGDLDKAATFATRLRYLDKLVDEARMRRRNLD